MKNFLSTYWKIILVVFGLFFMFTYLHGVVFGLLGTTLMSLLYWFMYKL